MGMGPLVDTLAQVDRVKSPIQVLVVAGRNEILRRQLVAMPHRHPTQVFGFVTQHA